MRNPRFFSILMLCVALTFQTIPAHSATKAGAKCTKAGTKSVVGNKTFTCIKSGKKLVWNKGIAVKKPTPTHTPTPAPLVLNWVYKSEVPLIPGTLLDGSPNEVQDNNLNSSFVIQALQNGLPAKGVKVRNPSFDVTPAELVTALITEKGIIYNPNKDNLFNFLNK